MDLQPSTDGDDVERCARCGAVAAGPCARCGASVCGDCCVLTDGGAGTWAVCTRCDRRGGRSLRGSWIAVLTWLLLPILALAAVVAALELVRPR